MIVYNIEDFEIKEMLRPYENIIVNTYGTEEEYRQRVKEVEKEIRKNPDALIDALENNRKAKLLVYSRLAKLNISFYKWLECPTISKIMSNIYAAQYAIKAKEMQ